MWIRVLSEWAGSPRCGQVADLPDALAADLVRSGLAEPVTVIAPADVPPMPLPATETAMAAPAEQAVMAKGKGRKRGA